MERAIHYCWFGKSPLSETAKASIESWRKYCPDYEIVEWNENNCDLDINNWVRSAYDAGMYAFVSDYFRFKAVYEYGGIYMDVGSNLVKPVDPLIKHLPFSAIEELTKTVNSGLVLAAEQGEDLIADILEEYKNKVFCADIDFLRSNTVNEIMTRHLEKYGYIREDKLQIVANWTVFPSEYFNPCYGFGGYRIEENTYSTHASSGSWTGPVDRARKKIIWRVAPYTGRRFAQVLARIITEIQFNGICGGIRGIFDKIVEVLKRKK